jgi:hypothetical protein
VKRPSVAIFVWGLMLAVLLAVLWTIFDWDWLSLVLAGAATAGTFVIAAIARLAAGGGGAAAVPAPAGAATPDDDDERTPTAAAPADVVQPPRLSFATVLVAIALSMILLGLEVGAAIWLIGIGLLLAGMAALVRELRAGREA